MSHSDSLAKYLADTERKPVAVNHSLAISRALAQCVAYGSDPVRSAVFVRIPEGDLDAIKCAFESAVAQHLNRGACEPAAGG